MQTTGFTKKFTHGQWFTLGAVLFCLFGFGGVSLPQKSLVSISSGIADIKVLGTSNLHNWVMEAKSSPCSAKFDFLAGNSNLPQALISLRLSIPVQNLKSGESLMDSRAYSALKSPKYASIDYVLTSASIVPKDKDRFQIKSTGNLSIAGVTKAVSMDVDCLLNADGSLTCTSSEKIKMTDFGIKPPVFMLGVLRTGDELTIDFTLVLNK